MEKTKRDLIELFELDELEPQKMEETLQKLSNLIFQAVLIRALPLLKEEELEDYEKIIEEDKSGEDLFNFLLEKVPDFEKMIKEESEFLRKNLEEKLQKEGL